MQDPTCDFNLKIYTKIFGKLSAKKFQQFGVYPKYLNEKAEILEFIESHLRIVDTNFADEVRRMTCVDFLQNQEWFRQIRIRFNANVHKESNSVVNLNTLFVAQSSTHSVVDLGAPVLCGKKVDSNEGVDPLLERVSSLRVPSKYFEHWKWLRGFFGDGSKTFLSFHELLIQTHVSPKCQGQKPNDTLLTGDL
jgi:hypothetical protein